MKLYLGLITILFSATFFTHLPGLKRAWAIQKIRHCVDTIPNRAMGSLSECVKRSLPGLVGSPDEPAVMGWLLDAHQASQKDQLALNEQAALHEKINGIAHSTSVKAETQKIFFQGFPLILFACGFVAMLSWYMEKRSRALGLRAQEKPKKGARNKPRLLIIDDDPLFARTAGRILEKRGFVVDCAESFREAKNFLSAEEYDVIFCDYYLNEVKGTELCDRLLKEEDKKRCVIVSGADKEEVFKKKKDQGYEFLQKPCSGDQLAQYASRIAAPGVA